jgi:hypothetical protein
MMATNWTIGRVWLLGTCVLIIGHLSWWGVAAEVPFSEALRLALFFVPAAAAFMVTYLSPRLKLVLGMSMGVVGAAIGFLAMRIFENAGYHIDKIGGAVETMVVLLALHLVYAIVGTATGYAVWRYVSRAR